MNGPKFIPRRRVRRVGTAVVAAAVGLATLSITTGAASADAPPWQQSGNVNNDPNAVGTLSFYDSTGTQIYSGDIDDTPFAAYVLGSTELRAGDAKAALFAYLPLSDTPAGAWTGQQLSAASNYPNSAAPTSLKTSTLPLVTTTAGDETLGEFVDTHPNGSEDPDYAGVYELRLRTSAEESPIGATYDVADIAVTGSSWHVVYPEHFTNTTTTLTADPASGAKVGDSVTLTATVAPTATGSVQFADGSAKLGSPVSLTASSAQKQVSLTTGGTHHFTATFVPEDGSVLAGSEGTLSYAVAKTTSKLVATWPSAKPHFGTAFSIKATVTAPGTVPTGTVKLKSGSKTISTATLSGGKATLKVGGTTLAPGKHSLTVSYPGSAAATSASATKSLTIVKATSKTTNALKKASIAKGKTTSLTVHVKAKGVTPTGTVSVFDGKKRVAKVTLTAKKHGTIVISLPTEKKLGKHKIHATYGGSAKVSSSSAKTVTLKVHK